MSFLDGVESVNNVIKEWSISEILVVGVIAFFASMILIVFPVATYKNNKMLREMEKEKKGKNYEI